MTQPPTDTERLVEELIAENAALTKALTGLTCGGSEFFVRKGERFVADIAACVGWVRRGREDAHRRTVEAILQRQTAEARAAAQAGEIERLRGALEAANLALADLPTMPAAYDWTGSGSDMFDNELRHQSGAKAIDFLRGWLSIFRQFGYATRDESWGELEKLISIVMRNYGEFAKGVRDARAALSPPIAGGQS